MESRIEKAIELHHKGFGCCQAVLVAYADLVNVDENILFGVGEGLGAGISKKWRTCGAVTGMVIVSSLLNSTRDVNNPTSKPNTYNVGLNLIEQFEKMNGTSICREIKGMDDGIVKRSCDGCIIDACTIIENSLIK